MPIGKDSITKRVAKTTDNEKNIAPELVATTAAAPAPKKPAAKTTTPKADASKTTAAKTTPKTAPAKSTAAKADTAKKEAPKAEKKPNVETTVLSNVAPETVAAVIGHKETEKAAIFQIGSKLPEHLL